MIRVIVRSNLLRRLRKIKGSALCTTAVIRETVYKFLSGATWSRVSPASVNATRAAVEEGIVPGGGVALLRCVAALDELKLEGDQAVGVTIVKRALEEPIRQIVINAGVEGAVIVMEVKKNKKAAFGFNAATEEYGDMIEAGIIDPTKVTRTALQNAASIAGLMITTECVIADKPEEDKKMGGGMPGGMGGMGGMGGGDMY